MNIGESKIIAIKFADDQAIVCGSTKTLQEMVDKINCRPEILIHGYMIEQVNHFCHLGRMMHARCKTEIRSRIGMAKIAFYENKQILLSKKTNITPGKRILKTYV